MSACVQRERGGKGRVSNMMVETGRQSKEADLIVHLSELGEDLVLPLRVGLGNIQHSILRPGEGLGGGGFLEQRRNSNRAMVS